jgi:hypothetical protein
MTMEQRLALICLGAEMGVLIGWIAALNSRQCFEHFNFHDEYIESV